MSTWRAHHIQRINRKKCTWSIHHVLKGVYFSSESTVFKVSQYRMSLSVVFYLDLVIYQKIHRRKELRIWIKNWLVCVKCEMYNCFGIFSIITNPYLFCGKRQGLTLKFGRFEKAKIVFRECFNSFEIRYFPPNWCLFVFFCFFFSSFFLLLLFLFQANDGNLWSPYSPVSRYLLSWVVGLSWRNEFRYSPVIPWVSLERRERRSTAFWNSICVSNDILWLSSRIRLT